MRVVSLCILACAASGCSAPESGPATVYDPCQVTVIAVGADASEAERQSVVEGVAMWNRTGVTRFTMDEVPGAPRVVVRFQDAAAAFHGFYDANSGELFVNHALAENHERAVTVAHELGHALGLPHVEDRVSVMRKANLVVEPTTDDVMALLALWGACPPR